MSIRSGTERIAARGTLNRFWSDGCGVDVGVCVAVADDDDEAVNVGEGLLFSESGSTRSESTMSGGSRCLEIQFFSIAFFTLYRGSYIAVPGSISQVPKSVVLL